MMQSSEPVIAYPTMMHEQQLIVSYAPPPFVSVTINAEHSGSTFVFPESYSLALNGRVDREEFSHIIRELNRIAKDNGSIFLNMGFKLAIFSIIPYPLSMVSLCIASRKVGFINHHLYWSQRTLISALLLALESRLKRCWRV